ncbi:MAG: hypothetical protein OXU20_09110 [Myxococcales bacterium]|nr:hypothetical protein [Myxococcales bacterium]MDD9969668.1 hypothetical protein [Myxococcales bacterium]
MPRIGAGQPLPSHRNLLEAGELDMLGELVNIAQGQAAAMLCSLVGVSTRLRAPRLQICHPTVAREHLASGLGEATEEFLIEQSARLGFCTQGSLLLSVHDRDAFRRELLLEATEPDAGGALEVGNLLMGTCLGQLAGLLGCRAAFSHPRLTEGRQIHWNGQCSTTFEVLLVETYFGLDNGVFDGRFDLVIPDWSWPMLRAALTSLEDDLEA